MYLIDDVAVVESGPHLVDTKQSYVIVRHVKFAPKKSGKKAVKPLDALTRVQSSAPNEPKAVSNSIEDEEWESVESDSETETDSEKIVAEHKNHKNPLPPSPPKSPNLELKKEAYVVEINRYSKQGEPRRPYQQRERMPVQATRNESDARGQVDPKLRFNSSKPDAPVDQNNSRAMLFGKLENQKPGSPNVDKLSNRSSSAPIFGKLNTSQTVHKSTNPSPTPSYGKLSASKTVSSGDQRKLEEVQLDKTRNSSSPARSYGIFSK